MHPVTRVAQGASRSRRCLLSLAVAVAALSHGVVLADNATITLDVTYNSGAGSAGIWELFGRVDATSTGANGGFGLSAVRALLTDIDFGVGGDALTLASGIGALDPIDLGGPNERPPAILKSTGVVDLIYGQDLSESNGNSLVFGVGVSGDALLAAGTFSAGMTPGFGQDVSLFTQALFLPSGSTPITSGAISADNTFAIVIDNLPLSGDYNLDGAVNAADYTVWRDNENSTTNLAADGNGDLVVNAADYTVWADNYGRSASSAAATIPEPAALGIASMAAAMIAAKRRW